MIAIAGYLAIFVALGAAIAIVVQGIRYSKSGDTAKLKVPVVTMLIAAIVAFSLLEIAILRADFSIAYVANNSATTTPVVFLFAAAWAALEGSIVLWGALLAIFMWLVWRTMGPSDGLGVLALAIMGAIAVFWFGLMATAGNPFAVCTDAVTSACSDSSWWPFVQSVAPLDGRGPNPLLQNDIMMALHPPLLTAGYVGFTVPFGFAIAALIRRDVGRTWLDRTHRWTLIAWILLAAGIIVGGWWSYEVLGWGGYWAWDPVENSAFLPWLTATAFIHSAVVQRRRGMLQSWNFILVIVTFSLTILGTFITRSGIIGSVHAFLQSVVGPALLVLLALVVVGSLALFVSRSSDIAQAPRLDSLSSREGYILANNLLLTVFAFTVLFGTMFPLILKATSGDEVAVGRPFFDRVSIPIALVILFVIGLGSVAPWRVASPKVLWERLRLASIVGLSVGAAAVIWGIVSLAVVITFILAAFILTAIIVRYGEVVRARPESVLKSASKVLRNEPGFWGGQIAHIGVALLAVAVATTGGLETRDTVSLMPGDSAVVQNYCIRFVEPFTKVEPHRELNGVVVELYDKSCTNLLETLRPSVNSYPAATQPIGAPDAWTGPVDDVYIGIASGAEGRIDLNVYIFPFQWLLWTGGIIILLGGGFAMFRKPTNGARDREPDEHVSAGATDV